MSTLVSFATCRRCQAQIEIPPLPIILGESAQEKATRLGALEMATICQHLVKTHPEARDHMTAWGTCFSEFYWLAQFDLSKCKVLLDQYDAQRLQLLSTCQVEWPKDGRDIEMDPRVVADFYEEHDRAAELEAAGYRISKGFLHVASAESLVKPGA